VLLNRCIARAHSTVDAREALEHLGYDVLDTAVPRREVYAQSFGMPIKQTGCEIWRQVARDLIGRGAPPCPVPARPVSERSGKRRGPPRQAAAQHPTRVPPDAPRSGPSRSGSPWT